MADNPLNSSPVRVLAEEVSQRDGVALAEAAQGQIVLIAAQTADGQVVTFDPRILATAAKQDTAKAVFDQILTSVDGLEALLGRLPAGGAASEATLSSVLGAVDGLEANTTNAAKTVDVQGVRDRLPASLVFNALPITDGGAYAYAAGTAAGTIDVHAGARVKRVSVIAGSGGSATVTIAGGNTITIPAGASFDEQIPGLATLGGDVVIGGSVTAYYVSWVA
jgi:hypothetical protein